MSLTQNTRVNAFLFRMLVRQTSYTASFHILGYPNERSDAVNLQELKALEDTDPPREERVDIKKVSVDMDAPVATRVQQLLEQVKNPYAFMCGDVAVNIEFMPEGKPLRKAMISYFSAQRKQ